MPDDYVFVKGWRNLVWILCMFDLPTKTKDNKKEYTKFRKFLLKDGYSMLQYSVYSRLCFDFQDSEKHIRRIKGSIPACGKVRFIEITDKQWQRTKCFKSKKTIKTEEPPKQIELF